MSQRLSMRLVSTPTIGIDGQRAEAARTHSQPSPRWPCKPMTGLKK